MMCYACGVLGTAPGGGAYSAQIIVPANQIEGGTKKCDIYVTAVSQAHSVSAKGYWLAMVSTTMETGDAKKDLQLGMWARHFAKSILSTIKVT